MIATRLLSLTILALLVVASASLAAEPEIWLRNGQVDEPGSAITVKSWHDVTIWVDAPPPAATSLSLTNKGIVAGEQRAVGLPLDDDMGAKLTAGQDWFEIIDQDCNGKFLKEPRDRNSTCFTLITPRSNWFRDIVGTLELRTGEYIKDIALKGRAHHFHPIDTEELTLEVVDGNPDAYDVNGGPFIYGREGNGEWVQGTTVTWRVTNGSSEYTTPALVTSIAGMTGNYTFRNNGCSGAQLAPGGSCTFQIQAQSDWWGDITGSVLVAARNMRIETRHSGSFLDPDVELRDDLNGKAHHFHRPRLEIEVLSGVPADMEVVGPAQPSYSAPVKVRVRNPTTEFPIQNVATELRDQAGPGSFEWTTNPCHNGTIQPLQTCDLEFRAAASWFGQKSATFWAYGEYIDSYVNVNNFRTLSLGGKAHYFDPMTSSLELISGNPSSYDVDGDYAWGRKFNGQFKTGTSATWRFTNNSAEYATRPLVSHLSNATNFQFADDTCTGRSIPAKGTCTFRVIARADWWGNLQGSLRITNPEHTIVTTQRPSFPHAAIHHDVELRGNAHHFDDPELHLALVSGTPNDMEVVGPAKPSFSHVVRLRLWNPTTEFSTGALTTQFLGHTGPGNYDFVSNGCGGNAINPASECFVEIRARAEWFGQMAATFSATSSNERRSLGRTQALAGKAHYFDVPRLELFLVSGNPTDMIVDGEFTYGQKYNGQVSKVATPTVWELRNLSSEYVTRPIQMGLTNSTNFYFENNTCNGVQIAISGTCRFEVRAQTNWWGTFAGELRLAQRDIQIVTTQRPSFYHPDIEITRELKGRGHRFHAPELNLAVLSGTPSDMEILGPGSRQSTTSHEIRVSLTNPTTEYTVGPISTTFQNIVGTGSYEFVSNGCSGQNLAPGDTCEARFRARSDWHTAMSAVFTATADATSAVALPGPARTATLNLSGRAHYFDPLKLELVQVSGAPANLDVDGEFAYGLLHGGTFKVGTGVQYRINNLSTEYASTPIEIGFSNTHNLVTTSDACTGVRVAASGSCAFTTSGRDNWWRASWVGNMTVASRNIWIYPTRASSFRDPDIAFARAFGGKSHHFDHPRLQLSTLSGNPTNLEILGPTQPSYSHTARIRIQNLSTEWPTYAMTSAVATGAVPSGGAYEFVSNGCSMALAASATCDVQIRARSSWFGSMAGTWTISGAAERTASLTASQVLSGRAMYFDPVRLTFARLSGNPTGFEIDGRFAGGTVASPSGQQVTYRITNSSTEFDSSSIAVSTTDSSKFVVSQCGVAGRNNGTCTFTVDAQSSWWGTYNATLNVSHPAITVPLTYSSPVSRDATSFSDSLKVRAWNFDPVRFQFEVVGGNPGGMDVVGPSKPSHSGTVTVRITNLSTEYSSSSTSRSISTGSAPSGSAYEFSGGGCTGEALAAQGACNAVLRASASWWGNMSGSVTVGANTGSNTNSQGYREQTFTLGGRAYYFDLPKLVMSPTSAHFGTITGWAQGVRINGGSAAFTVTNQTTEWPSDSVSFGTSGPFEVTGSSCGVLGAGSSCSVTVRAYAESNGNHNGTLSVQQHQRPSASLSVSAAQFYTYGWIAEPWGECSKICNGGTQTSTVWCRRDDGANMGSNGGTYPGCESGSKPATSQDCNTLGCTWASNAWGQCDQPCNGGRQTRTNYCTNPNSGGATVANFHCQAGEPANSQSCNTSSCYWSVGEYGTCDASCGGGWRTRPLYCNAPASGVVSHNYCSGPTPELKETCNTQSCCNANNWTRQSTGTCSASCGGGKRTVIEVNDCGTPRDYEEDCNTQSCVVYGTWSCGYVTQLAAPYCPGGVEASGTCTKFSSCYYVPHGRGSAARCDCN